MIGNLCDDKNIVMGDKVTGFYIAVVFESRYKM